MRIATFVMTIGLLTALSTNASAQEKRVHVNLGGGPTFTLGDISERFTIGWGPAIGVTVDATERVGVQFEYAYRYFGLKDELDIQAGRFDANHQMHQLDFNLVVNLTPPDSGVRGYLVAGPGMYYRQVEITEYEGTGVICDPWFYVCGTYPITSVVGSRGGWDFGMNVGAGVGFRIGDSSEFFVETRYHYVWGPEITPVGTPPAGTAVQKSTGQYWPLTFGVRF